MGAVKTRHEPCKHADDGRQPRTFAKFKILLLQTLN